MNGAGNKVGIEADRVITAAGLLTPQHSYQFRGEHWSQTDSRDLWVARFWFLLIFMHVLVRGITECLCAGTTTKNVPKYSTFWSFFPPHNTKKTEWSVNRLISVRIHWQRIICRLISNINSNQQQLVTALNWLFVTEKIIALIIINVIFAVQAD